MKYVISIFAVVLIAIALVLLLGRGLSMPLTLEEVSLLLVKLAAPAVLAVLTVVQLYKPVPRLTLLFGGMVSLTSVLAALQGSVPYMLLLAAGLAASVYELVSQEHAAKGQQTRRGKSGLLIAAGILSFMYVAVYILAATVTLGYIGQSFPVVFMSSMHVVIAGVGTGVFCFLKERRTHMFYRMFFVGLPVAFVLIEPFNSVRILLLSGIDIGPVVIMLKIALLLLIVVFVLIDAAKYRYKDFTLLGEAGEAAAV